MGNTMRGLSFPLLFNKPSQPASVVVSTTPVAGYVAWYDAADTASITHVANAVSQWNDKSGNGYHLLQAVAGLKPITNSVTINSLNTINFDGVDDKLLSTAFVVKLQPFTIFVVAKFTSDILRRDLIDGLTFGTGFNANNILFAYSGGGGVPNLTGDPALNNATPHLFVWIPNGASASDVYIDGGAAIAAGAASRGISGLATFGLSSAAGPFPGPVAEFIVYHSALSTVDRQSVEAYLKAKWATP